MPGPLHQASRMEVEPPNTHLGCCESPGQTLSPALPFPAYVSLGVDRPQKEDYRPPEMKGTDGPEGQPSHHSPPPATQVLTSRMGPLQ